ncbi:MAG TPA: sigma-70 family RNA polymerase sigma factor [Streptosporangiaceae bacterium]|jgi:RNA polymerase sigma-70 factor (sigma-E family)
MDAELMGPAGPLASAGPPGEAEQARSWPAGAADVTQLFREHQLELVRLALLMGVDMGTAEDVVQDAFERLHRRWRQLRDPASGLAYARSSVLNGCRSVHRRAAVARRHAPHLAQIPADTGTAAQHADRAEMAAALRQVSRRQREVLVLRYYADLDTAEIGQTLGIRQAAVRSHASRGLAALARIFQEG